MLQRVGTERGRRKEDEWFVAVDWEASALAPAQAKAPARFVLLGDGGGLGGRVRDALEREGHSVLHAVVGPVKGHRHGAAPRSRDVDDASASALRALMTDAFDGAPPSAVVHLRSLEEDGTDPSDAVEGALRRGCDSVLRTVQAMTSMGWRDAPRLWIVTRGAQAVGRGDSVSFLQAPVLGLGRVIAIEHQELACTRVDLDPAARGD